MTFRIKNILPVEFNKKLFVSLTVGFILAAILGALSMNVCKYIVAKRMGCTTKITYYGVWAFYSNYSTCDTIRKYKPYIKAKKHFPGEEMLKEVSKDYSWIELSPLVQNMTLGTIGFILLLLLKGSFRRQEALRLWQWFLVFLALCWLTKCCALLIWLWDGITNGNLLKQYNSWWDVASLLHLASWILVVLSGVVAFSVVTIVVFYFVPRKQRFTFIISGLVGGSIAILLPQLVYYLYAA